MSVKSTRNEIPSRLWFPYQTQALREPQGYWNHGILQSGTTQPYAGIQGLVGIHVPSHDRWTLHLLEHSPGNRGGQEALRSIHPFGNSGETHRFAQGNSMDACSLH